MMKIRAATAIVAVLAALLFGSQNASTQMTKLTVGYSAISGDQLPAWVAKEAGLFKKHGLDMDMIFINGSTRSIQSLIAGDLNFAGAVGTSAINGEWRAGISK